MFGIPELIIILAIALLAFIAYKLVVKPQS